MPGQTQLVFGKTDLVGSKTHRVRGKFDGTTYAYSRRSSRPKTLKLPLVPNQQRRLEERLRAMAGPLIVWRSQVIANSRGSP